LIKNHHNNLLSDNKPVAIFLYCSFKIQAVG